MATSVKIKGLSTKTAIFNLVTNVIREYLREGTQNIKNIKCLTDEYGCVYYEFLYARRVYTVFVFDDKSDFELMDKYADEFDDRNSSHFTNDKFLYYTIVDKHILLSYYK